VIELVFGNGRKSVGKKEIEMDDGRIMICDIDEFGNIIPSTCEELIEKSRAVTREYSFPERRMPQM
jgi:hypothetical protein